MLMAWGITSVLFVGLSVYTYANPCNHDFASWGTALFCVLSVSVIWGFFMMIFGTSFLL